MSTKSLVTCFTLSLTHQQNGPVLRPSYSVYRPARSGASPSSERASLSGDRDHRAQPQKTEAERDDSLTKVQPSLFKNYSPSCSVTGNAEGRMESTVANKDGGLIESTGDSTTVWSSMELDMNYGQSAKCWNCDWNGCVVLCCAVLHFRTSHSSTENTSNIKKQNINLATCAHNSESLLQIQKTDIGSVFWRHKCLTQLLFHKGVSPL